MTSHLLLERLIHIAVITSFIYTEYGQSTADDLSGTVATPPDLLISGSGGMLHGEILNKTPPPPPPSSQAVQVRFFKILNYYKCLS